MRPNLPGLSPPVESQSVHWRAWAITDRVRALCDKYSAATGIKLHPHLLRHVAHQYLADGSFQQISYMEARLQLLGHEVWFYDRPLPRSDPSNNWPEEATEADLLRTCCKQLIKIILFAKLDVRWSLARYGEAVPTLFLMCSGVAFLAECWCLWHRAENLPTRSV